MDAVQPEPWLWALITNNNNNTFVSFYPPFNQYRTAVIM
jgi:hypothetical protein